MLRGISGTQGHQGLLGNGRIAVRFLGRGQNVAAVLQELLVNSAPDDMDGPLLRMRWSHEPRLYAGGARGLGLGEFVFLLPDQGEAVANVPDRADQVLVVRAELGP
ncbi:hypothetical protein GCM10007170_12570 [Arthrobacter liuii]|uniref:Uncharacterized protein n=1 Tax=Arthrobacter liuii TaxID=1476996 RepID=A0ABQ2ANJ3_9MICC|nr:hypothetical protein GCM10007170_12570 [Arthrobacter liuii]